MSTTQSNRRVIASGQIGPFADGVPLDIEIVDDTQECRHDGLWILIDELGTRACAKCGEYR